MTDDDYLSATEAMDEDTISEIARKRREVAEQDSAVPRPDFVTNVEHSEVIYTLDPLAIPLENVHPAGLVDALNAAFDVSLAPLSISPLLEKVPRDQLLKMDEAEVLSRLMRTPPAVLRFEAGRFPLRNDFVPIRSIEINYESIIVRVVGVTSVAEAIAQDTLELLWKLAGAPRRWDDLSGMILVQGYGTATRVNFSVPTERFVEKRIVDTIQKNLTSGKALSRKMGLFKPGISEEDLGLTASVFFDDLVLMVSKYSPSTGASHQSEVQISVTAKNDYGTGRLRITSQLDYDDHIALLHELFAALT